MCDTCGEGGGGGFRKTISICTYICSMAPPAARYASIQCAKAALELVLCVLVYSLQKNQERHQPSHAQYTKKHVGAS